MTENLLSVILSKDVNAHVHIKCSGRGQIEAAKACVIVLDWLKNTLGDFLMKSSCNIIV